MSWYGRLEPPQPQQPSVSVANYTVQDFKDVPLYFQSLQKLNCLNDRATQLFMSPQNAYRIHLIFAENVRRATGVRIAQQESKALAAVMAAMYQNFFQRHGVQFTEQTIDLINADVVNAITPKAIAALQHHILQMKEFDQVAMPIALPVSTSRKGLDGRRFVELT